MNHEAYNYALTQGKKVDRVGIFIAGNDIRKGNDATDVAWEMDRLSQCFLRTHNVEIVYFDCDALSDRVF